MKNLLQALSDIEPPKVEDKKRLIQEGAGPGQILNVQMEDLDAASLRYLSGVRKILEECGMTPPASMPSSAPPPPATLNITAANAHELGTLLKTMTGLNGDGDYKHEPVYRADPSPLHHSDNGEFDMRGMVKLIDDGEFEEDLIQDQYDNTPSEQYLDANWPQEGDQNNSVVAAKDKLVHRGDDELTTESLMADYRAFVAEVKIDQNIVDADRLRQIREAKRRIEELEELLRQAKLRLSQVPNDVDRTEVLNNIESLERALTAAKGNVPSFDIRKQSSPEGTGSIFEAWNVKTKVNPKEKGKYKGKTAAQLRKQLNSLKKSGPHKKGSKEYGKMRELQFAIRAKSGWGKVSNSKKKTK